MAPRLRRLTLPRSSNSPAHYAKGTQSGLPPCGGIALLPLVSKRFQVLFHSPHRGSFAFPSRYWFTIGRRGIFSLGGWSPQIPTGLHVSRSTWERSPERSVRFRLPGYHRLWRLFPEPSTIA